MFVYPRDFYPFWSIMEIFFNIFRCHEWYSNLSIPRQKPNRFHHTDVFPSWNLRLLNLSPIFSMIQVCAGFCSVLLSGVSVPRGKWWMYFHLTIMWSDYSFHHWYIFITQSLLLSLCKALNLIPTSIPRNNVLKSKLVTQREIYAFKLQWSNMDIFTYRSLLHSFLRSMNPTKNHQIPQCIQGSTPCIMNMYYNP